MQLTLAYALTMHKSQGLTMDVTYPSLTKISGFGLPYTACSRTPFRHNILCVGVPPLDVFRRLTEVSADGTTLVDRKRVALEQLLQDDAALHTLVMERVHTGEHSIATLIAERRAKATSTGDVAIAALPHEALHGLVIAEFTEKLKQHTRAWVQRLDMRSGLERMASVSEDVQVPRTRCTR